MQNYKNKTKTPFLFQALLDGAVYFIATFNLKTFSHSHTVMFITYNHCIIQKEYLKVNFTTYLCRLYPKKCCNRTLVFFSILLRTNCIETLLKIYLTTIIIILHYIYIIIIHTVRMTVYYIILSRKTTDLI